MSSARQKKENPELLPVSGFLLSSCLRATCCLAGSAYAQKTCFMPGNKPPSCGFCSTFPSLCHCLFCLGFFPQRPQHKLHVGGDPGLPAVNLTSLPSLDLYLHVLLTLAILPPIAHLSTDTLCSPCLLLGIIPHPPHPFPAKKRNSPRARLLFSV